jgi:hypothetical protein
MLWVNSGKGERVGSVVTACDGIIVGIGVEPNVVVGNGIGYWDTFGDG